MTKKSILTLTVIIALMSVMLFAGMCSSMTAKALETQPDTVYEEQDDGRQQRGLVTQISLSIGAENSEVWAEAHNDFTLGFSTILVYVELYSSYSYQEDYSSMNFESRNFISDLNIGETIRTTAFTNGERKYWQARMRYKFDDRDWVIKNTKTYLIEADGSLVG